mmetsp:Transcript_46748/g.74784  ORF Transcript_46748/g.74784 Transcript_46748/m.74784 type:complete len:316 (+) Transcript_46748:1553-2500(+)
MLTSLSWITFLMDQDNLGERCMISLTLLLALNVFQLILSELMPKTGYLTPMHEFVIVSTFFTMFAAVESAMSSVLHNRMNVRAAFADIIKTASKERLALGAEGGFEKEDTAFAWEEASARVKAARMSGIRISKSGGDGAKRFSTSGGVAFSRISMPSFFSRVADGFSRSGGDGETRFSSGAPRPDVGGRRVSSDGGDGVSRRISCRSDGKPGGKGGVEDSMQDTANFHEQNTHFHLHSNGGEGRALKVDIAEEALKAVGHGAPCGKDHGRVELAQGQERAPMLERMESAVAKHIDRVSLIFTPIVYAVYTAIIFQ